MGARRFRPGPYLAFRLARRDFAVEACRVRAILPRHELSPLDESRDSDVLGMARIAGQEFPVVDLVSRLGLPQAPHGRSPSIIAIEVETSFGSALVGFVADTTPAVIQVRERDFRRGRIRAGGRPRNVLDVDAALAPEFGGILP